MTWENVSAPEAIWVVLAVGSLIVHVAMLGRIAQRRHLLRQDGLNGALEMLASMIFRSRMEKVLADVIYLAVGLIFAWLPTRMGATEDERLALYTAMWLLIGRIVLRLVHSLLDQWDEVELGARHQAAMRRDNAG